MSQKNKNTGKTLLGGLLAIVLAIIMMLSGGDLSSIGSDDLTALPPESGSSNNESVLQDTTPAGENETIREDGQYSSKTEVGRYLYLYGRLPSNYLTKDEASDLGWDNKKGNLWEVAPGMSIGGDRFGNYEGLLPKGKTYYECDINYQGGYRGAERIIYSTDGYIYYTGDHYETFEQLYP